MEKKGNGDDSGGNSDKIVYLYKVRPGFSRHSLAVLAAKNILNLG